MISVVCNYHDVLKRSSKQFQKGSCNCCFRYRVYPLKIPPERDSAYDSQIAIRNGINIRLFGIRRNLSIPEKGNAQRTPFVYSRPSWISSDSIKGLLPLLLLHMIMCYYFLYVDNSIWGQYALQM